MRATISGSVADGHGTCRIFAGITWVGSRDVEIARPLPARLPARMPVRCRVGPGGCSVRATMVWQSRRRLRKG